MHILVCLIVSCKSIKQSTLSFILFFFCLCNWKNSTALSSSHWFFFPLDLTWYWNLLSNFSVQVLYSQFYLFGTFQYFLSLCWNYHLFMYCCVNLNKHLYDHYFELPDKSLVSISLRSISVILFLFQKYFSLFTFLHPLCWFLHIKWPPLPVLTEWLPVVNVACKSAQL